MDGDWKLFSHDSVTGKTVYMLEDEHTIVFKTVTPVDDIFEDNAASYNASLNERWGDGKVVASLPLDFYFRKIVPARQNGDNAYVKKILNDSDYAKFRSFKGRV